MTKNRAIHDKTSRLLAISESGQENFKTKRNLVKIISCPLGINISRPDKLADIGNLFISSLTSSVTKLIGFLKKMFPAS